MIHINSLTELAKMRLLYSTNGIHDSLVRLGFVDNVDPTLMTNVICVCDFSSITSNSVYCLSNDYLIGYDYNSLSDIYNFSRISSKATSKFGHDIKRIDRDIMLRDINDPDRIGNYWKLISHNAAADNSVFLLLVSYSNTVPRVAYGYRYSTDLNDITGTVSLMFAASLNNSTHLDYLKNEFDKVVHRQSALIASS